MTQTVGSDTSSVARAHTLASSASACGVALHSGGTSKATIHPAEWGTGIVFRVGRAVIPALAENVVDTRRCTSLGGSGVRIDTVEHLLSALWGLGVSDARIDVDGGETPILDGSALPWIELIRGAGLVAGDRPAPWVSIREPIAVSQGDAWLVAAPSDTFQLTSVTSFDHPLLGTQALTVSDCADEYVQAVAPARTFGFAHEVEALLKAGLALGGTLENALIVRDDGYSDRLRLPDECARHKVLDLVGDLALIGARIRGAVTAIRPGHAANAAFSRLVRERHGMSQRTQEITSD